MADLPDWAARWLERQSRVVDAVESVKPFDRVPRAWLIRLLHAAGLFALLSVGVVAHGSLVWALVAIPMTMIVVLGLAGRDRTPERSPAAGRRDGPFDQHAGAPSTVEPSYDSPIVVRRRQPAPIAEPLFIPYRR